MPPYAARSGLCLQCLCVLPRWIIVQAENHRIKENERRSLGGDTFSPVGLGSFPINHWIILHNFSGRSCCFFSHLWVINHASSTVTTMIKNPISLSTSLLSICHHTRCYLEISEETYQLHLNKEAIQSLEDLWENCPFGPGQNMIFDGRQLVQIQNQKPKNPDHIWPAKAIFGSILILVLGAGWDFGLHMVKLVMA